MTALVVDASAWVEYLLGTDGAAATRECVEASDVALHVPALCDVEVVAALRRALLSPRPGLDALRASEALQDYLDLPLGRHGHEALLARTLELRDNFSTYDAVYVALAERLDAKLVTGDRRLAKAVRSHLGVDVSAVRCRASTPALAPLVHAHGVVPAPPLRISTTRQCSW